MSNQPYLAKNIDEVIARLEQIIAESESNNDRLGYFAALYHKVTVKVKEGIANGQFSNGESLERLDVTFANRYFTALDQWRNGQLPSKCWHIAFDNSKKSSRLVLQHLLLGMNAHINLDLGIATVEVASGKLEDMRSDFYSINMILASLTYDVISKLNTISPLLSFLGFSGTKSNSMLIQFSMGNARDGSWCFAEDLAKKEKKDYDQFIATRDADIAGLADSLTKASWAMSLGIWLIHLFEWKNVKRIINILHDYQKPYKKDMEAAAKK